MSQVASESGSPAPPSAGAEVSILRVRVRELEEFARRTAEEARQGGVVAISPERARAQARNPFAQPDDVALVVAYVGGRCEGYMGLFAGCLREGGRDRRVTWMTTWYASPRVRRMKVGYRLLTAACEETTALIATVVSDDAAKVFRTSMMGDMPRLAYHIVDLRRAVPWSLLLRKVASRAGARGLLPRVERGLFAPARAALLALLTARYAAAAAAARLRPVEVSSLDDDDFAPVPADAVRFVRGARVVNWMLAHPWVTEASTPPDDGWRDYYFSRTRPLFRYTAYRFHTEAGGRAGFAVLGVTEERGHRAVRLLDHELRGPADAEALLGLVLQYARRWRADSLVLAESLGPALRGPVWRVLSRRTSRPYFCNLAEPDGELAALLKRAQLDRCDADVAFV